MSWKTITTFFLIAMVVAFVGVGCSKGKKEEKAAVEKPAVAEGAIILTNDMIDEFLKVYPTVFSKMAEKKDALEKYRDDNPVVSAQGQKAVEELKMELASEGIDLGRFNAIYQKILLATYYITQKQRAESIPPEARKAKIDELKKRADSPDVSEQDKANILQAVAELEATTSGEVKLPPGLSEGEAKLVEARFDEIRTAIMAQVNKVRDKQDSASTS